jgi:hypothetical protein
MPSDRPSSISRTFRDGSQITITPLGVNEEGRQRYAYALTQEGRTLDAGDDLCSGVGAEVDLPRILGAWTSFAGANAETYRSTMSGDEYAEWTYQHDDELSELSLELEPDAGIETRVVGSAATEPVSGAGASNVDTDDDTDEV